MPYFFGGPFCRDCFFLCQRAHRKTLFLEFVGFRSRCGPDNHYFEASRGRTGYLRRGIACVVAGLFIAVPSHRVLTGITTALLIVLVFIFPNSKSLMQFTPRPDDGTGYYQLLAAKEKGMGGEITNEFSQWNIVGRIDIWKQAGNKLKVPEETDYRLMTVDSGAATVLVAGLAGELGQRTF